MTAASYDITIERHAGFSKTFTWTINGTPVNLSGYTAEAQIRRGFNTDLLATFTVALGGAAGTIIISLTAAQTTLVNSNGRWDLLLTASGGEPTRLLQGAVSISNGISQ